MNTLMGMQGVGLLMTLIIGGLAGLIAEKLTRSSHGLLINVVLGIAGALFMRFVLNLLGIHIVFAGWFFGNLIIATTGAALLIVLLRMIKGR